MRHQFDELAKAVAGGISRREALRRVGAGLAATLLASLGLETAWGGGTCSGVTCARNQLCMNGVCHTVCGPGRRACLTAGYRAWCCPGTSACGSTPYTCV
jgi:hypothetical protein